MIFFIYLAHAIIRTVITNLMKCEEAIEQDQCCSKVLLEGYFSKPNGILTTEDSLLELAASDVCNGIFYASIIKLNENQYMARYFQHGRFNGFFTIFRQKVSTELNLENTIPYSVYTDTDIEIQQKRHKNQYITMRKGRLSKVILFLNSLKLCVHF